jgi:hypothetical protein
VLNDDELTLYYSDVDGLLGRAVFVCLTGVPLAFSLLLLFYAVVQHRIVLSIVLTAIALFFGYVVARFAALGWRSARGGWWLRLTPVGFEANDRVFRPRRYRWSDIDRFVMVGADGQLHTGVVSQAQTVADVLKNGEALHSVRVGFRFLPEKRRRRRRPADHYVMGWWDRPLDQAVDLMNEWLTRSRGDMAADQR